MKEYRKNLFIGGAFILIGAVWALDNVELINWKVRYYLFNWENILIAIGAYLLLTRENIRVGAMLLAVGVFFSLDDWFSLNVRIWDLWPLALVFVGIYLIGRDAKSKEQKFQATNDEGIDPDFIDDTAIFSGGDRVINTKNFKGGNLTAIFGGSNIDLTSCEMGNEVAVLDVFFMFGGSKIRVPHNWHVEIRNTSLFGGMSDSRKTFGETNLDKKLVIKGLILFGGAEIIN